MRSGFPGTVIVGFVMVLALGSVAPVTGLPARAAPATIDDRSGRADDPAARSGTIDQAQLGHDSRDPLYRNPGGPVTAGTPVTLRLRAASGDLTGARVRLWNDHADAEMFRRMERVADDGTHEWWEATIPASDVPAIYWYRFIAIDGDAVAYYEDDGALTGGWGKRYETSPDHSWQLTVYDPDFRTPDWVKNAVIYQIFPDRFRDGDPANNRQAGAIFYDDGTIYRSHGTDWNEPLCDPRDADGACPGAWNKNFYGGDLQGIIDKLDYLDSLGVTALYLNPIFDSPSTHRYDTSDFHRIDPALGDLETFRSLASKAEARGIRLILDGVFNHTSSDSVYFDRYERYGSDGACESHAGPYRDWYIFEDVAAGTGPCVNDAGEAGAADYESWFGFDTLPKLDSGHPGVRAYFWNDGNAVGPYWLEEGAAGWRLDVAGDIDPGRTNDPANDYWEGFRSAVREVAPDAYIVGEEWGLATPWLLGNEWDATMNYQLADAMLGFWRDTAYGDNDYNPGSPLGKLEPLGPSAFNARVLNLQERYPPEALGAMMNLLGSHDTSRPLFYLDSRTGDHDQSLYEDSTYDWSDAVTRLKGVALLQMTLPGAPAIYYGDEAGLVAPPSHDGTYWQDDPYNRVPYPWLDESGTPFYMHLQSDAGQNQLRDYYRLIIQTRNDHPALRTGTFDPLLADDGNRLYAYGRKLADHSDAAIVVVNRDSTEQAVTLDVAGYLPVGATFDDVLRDGLPVAVDNDGRLMVTVPANGGVLLVPLGSLAGPPAAVTDLQVTQRSQALELGWSAASGADSYDIYRSLLSGGGYELVTNVTGTTYLDTGLANATAYHYVIVSRNDTSRLASDRSNEVSGIPHHDLDPGRANIWYNLQWPHEITHTVSAITPTGRIYGQIWIDGETGSADGPAEGIRAQAGFGPAGSEPGEAWQWAGMDFNVLTGNNDEYMGTLLPDETGEYAYTVRWSSDGGRSWYYADSEGPYGRSPDGVLGVMHVVGSDDTTAPPAPENLRITDRSTGHIVLAWDPVTAGDLAGYEIYRREGSSSEFTRVARHFQRARTETSYTDWAITGNTEYQYYVRAFDSSFNRSERSDIVDATTRVRDVEVTFNVTVPDYTPATDGIFIAGDHEQFGPWDPAATALARIDGNRWSITLTFREGTELAYKFTRGDWERVEKAADGSELPNRALRVAYGSHGTQVVEHTVEQWRDPLVVSASPADGAHGVSPATSIEVTWSKEMAEDTRFAVEGPAGSIHGTFRYASATQSAIFTPDAPLAGGSYTIRVAGQQDSLGDRQQVPSRSTFAVDRRIFLPALHRTP